MKKLALILAMALMFSLAIGNLAFAERGLEGKWKALSVEVDDEETMQAYDVILKNGEMYFTFDKGSYMIEMQIMGLNESSNGTYTVIGDYLSMSDLGVVKYTINGDTLVLEDNGSKFTLTYAGDDAQAASLISPETEGEVSLFGTWKMVDVQCDDEEMQNLYNMVLQYGAVTLAINEDNYTLTVKILGQEQSEQAQCVISENNIVSITDDSIALIEYSLNGNQLSWNNVYTGFNATFEKEN